MRRPSPLVSALAPLGLGLALALAAGPGCLDSSRPSQGAVDGGGPDAGVPDGQQDGQQGDAGAGDATVADSGATDGKPSDVSVPDGGPSDIQDTGGDPCANVDCPPSMPCPPGSSAEVLPGECCGGCVADTCVDDSGCTQCAFPTAPTTVDGCYCVACAATPLTTERCAFNQASWVALCQDVPLPCPAIDCMEPPPVGCFAATPAPVGPEAGDPAAGVCMTKPADPCAGVDCAVPECVGGHVEVPPGECCPVCVQDTCAADGDCTMCAYPTAPATADDCYCPECPSTAMTDAACTFNAAAWQTVCADVPVMCPDVACQEPPPAVCMGDAPGGPKQCVEGVVDPCANVDCPMPECPADQQITPPGACCPVCAEPPEPTVECVEDSDCTLCMADFAPTSTAECQCLTCGTYTSVATCEANTAAYATFCGADVWPERASCMPPPCPAPPPAGCNQGYVCGPDECAMAFCEPLDCPPAEQVTPPGACCPVCAPANTCKGAADCAWCLHPTAPTSVADCACPACPSNPMTAAQCAANTAAFNYYCNSQTWPQIDACQPPPCVPPGPLACGADGQCTPQPDVMP